MYPSRFRYEAPRTIDEAISLLHAGDGEAKVLAGGQSLVPMMKLRFATPEMLVDINNLPGLDYHRVGADGALRIGALCRHADLEHSSVLAAPPADDGRRRAAGRRPDRPQPRHPRRLAVPRRPAGRLGSGPHRARRPRRRAGRGRAADHRDRRLRHRALPERRWPTTSWRSRRSIPAPKGARPAATSSSSAGSATSPPPAAPWPSSWTATRSCAPASRSPGVGGSHHRRRRGRPTRWSARSLDGRRHRPGRRARRRGRRAAVGPPRQRGVQAAHRAHLRHPDPDPGHRRPDHERAA